MTMLLLGAGNNRLKKIHEIGGADKFDLSALVTLDIDPGCCPDVIHDLNILPYPFNDNQFKEIHAYDVLEHTGTQGDWRFFFDQFTEFWRILKPAGRIFMSFPTPQSIWAFGDPGHTRVLTKDVFVFLNQASYESHVGKTSMTDYRHYYKSDFRLIHMEVTEDSETQIIVLEAIK